MAGIAAIYNLDDQPVQPELVPHLRAAIAHRGPDGTSGCIDGPVALAHAAFHTTPESVGEAQPLVDKARGLSIVFDGRIDNREEIAGARCTASDADVVLQAYAQWEKECPAHLIGDFAFVIWDRPNRRLFCARDVVGVKPFYYTNSRETFACSSAVGALLAVPGVETKPNEGMVGEFLANSISSQEETLLSGILRLPAAHAMCVEPGGVRKWRYWDIDTARSIRYATDAEYQAHFLELFEEAVRCRLRGDVGAELSGGLDSSSVVTIANRLGDNSRPLETFSIVCPGMPCDESDFSAAVIEKLGVPATCTEPFLADASLYMEEAETHHAFPGYPNTHMSRPLKELAKTRGCSALLTGLGGDEWFSGNPYRYADHIRRGQLVTLAKEVHADYETVASRTVAADVLRFGLLPLVGRPIRRRLRALRPRRQAPHFLEPEFAARIGLQDRVRPPAAAHPFDSLAQGDLYSTLRNGAWTHGNEVEERATAALGLEHRHPFFDRRLIEFAMAIPGEQHWRNGVQKRVLRGAMGRSLPHAVANRHDKVEFSAVFTRSFLKHGGDGLFDRLEIAERGWLDHASARDAYKMLNGRDSRDETGSPNVWHLWQIYGLELWHRALFSGARTNNARPLKETTDGQAA